MTEVIPGNWFRELINNFGRKHFFRVAVSYFQLVVWNDLLFALPFLDTPAPTILTNCTWLFQQLPSNTYEKTVWPLNENCRITCDRKKEINFPYNNLKVLWTSSLASLHAQMTQFWSLVRLCRSVVLDLKHVGLYLKPRQISMVKFLWN